MTDRDLRIPSLYFISLRTLFTGVQRYCYVDTSYAFTEEEEEQRRRHRKIYADFTRQLGKTRLQETDER